MVLTGIDWHCLVGRYTAVLQGAKSDREGLRWQAFLPREETFREKGEEVECCQRWRNPSGHSRLVRMVRKVWPAAETGRGGRGLS